MTSSHTITTVAQPPQKSFNSQVFRDIKEFFGTVEYSETYQMQAGIKEFFGTVARKNHKYLTGFRNGLGV